ncbi:MAG TPA: hypothetical protein VMW65_14515 [Chloroflexota bacterium]|nr:hypothetical protein [Chloroflexota bacterium]
MAGNQVTPIHDANPFVGEPQANLWLGKTDDLWQFGKPKGWGGRWWEEAIEVDFLGNQSWHTYDTITVGSRGYAHHEFPPGFSAHWVRLRIDTTCQTTGYFIYT